MKTQCKFCFKDSLNLIIQFSHKPQVEVCLHCHKIVYIDLYDTVWVHYNTDIPRAQYVQECEAELQADGLIERLAQAFMDDENLQTIKPT